MVENILEHLQSTQTAVTWRPKLTPSVCTAQCGHGAIRREQDTLWPSGRKYLGKLFVLLCKLAEGGRDPTREHQVLFWNERVELKAFQTALILIRTAHHFVRSPVTLHFSLRVYRFLRIKARAPNSLAVRDPSRAFLWGSWTALCLGTSSASRPERANLPHAADRHLSLHVEESCRGTLRTPAWLRITTPRPRISQLRWGTGWGGD